MAKAPTRTTGAAKGAASEANEQLLAEQAAAALEAAELLAKKADELKVLEEALDKRKAELDTRENNVNAREEAVGKLEGKTGKGKATADAPEKGSVRITSKKDGFRRAGMAHTGQETHEPGTFSPFQLEQLRTESNLKGGKLVVEFF